MSDVVILAMLLIGMVAMFGGGAWVNSIIGAILQRRREKGQPICGCGHHFSFHEPSKGICKQHTRHVIGYDGGGDPVYEIGDCSCQQYVGPMPEVDYQIIRELGQHQPREM